MTKNLFLGHPHGQMNVTSPAATDFVKYERIPVSYFNGLPSIDIPLYTLDYKDLHLPIHLSYYASGIQLNQYPTCVGLGWNLSAGGCITRVVNGIPDETCAKDVKDQIGTYIGPNPGYYYFSKTMDNDDWASEHSLINYIDLSNNTHINYDLQPDEFVVNAYGVSGSVYFYRDKNDNVKAKVKSNNGESFRVEPPVILKDQNDITFRGGPGEPLKAYRVYELFYEFTVIKNDGTKLIFGGDDSCIEFYTEKKYNGNLQYLKTWPSAWMLREVITPDGNRMTFEYMRNGSPIIISDVITDIARYSPDWEMMEPVSTAPDRGVSFIVQHPVYPWGISIDGGPEIDFAINKSVSLNTVGTKYEYYMETKGFSKNIEDHVCYQNGSNIDIPYAPHNYSQELTRMRVLYNGNVQHSFGFVYTGNKDERLKLQTVVVRGGNEMAENKYTFKYNALRLPAYNATVTDNWGYWNNKDYRRTDIENDFFGFRSSSEYYTKAEVLTEIQYPTGGNVKFDYELNDYSKVATQAPDFKILEQSGQAGGLRIKKMTYSTDTTSYIHSFEYKNEDGTSSGILSGIPVYVAKGGNYNKCYYSGWDGLVYMHIQGKLEQRYIMYSETYINSLGLTTGNYVTYSRVVESVGEKKPLVKEYRYTNHDNCPDTADFKMYTNIDNVSLDNKFTSRALMRGLLMNEIWYSDGKKVKEISQSYNGNPSRFDDYAKSIEPFTIPGVTFLPIILPFVRYTPYKILTFYPYVESRTETLYDPSGRTVMSSVTENFTYNGNLMPTRVTKNMSDGSIETQTTTYPDDYNTDILNQMTGRGMVSSPVESMVYVDGKVADGKLNEYKQENSIFFPGTTWKLRLTEGLDSTDFFHYNGTARDSRYVVESEVVKIDKIGNPLIVKDASGVPTSYKWGYSGAYPTAIVNNATNTYDEQTLWEPEIKSKIMELDPEPKDWMQNLQTYGFTTYETGDVKFDLIGALGYDWFVIGTLDDEPFGLVQMRSMLPLVEPWDEYSKKYTSTVTFRNVPKGYHAVNLHMDKVRTNSSMGNNEMGQLSIRYTGRKGSTESFGEDEFLYEDFESWTMAGTYPFGYQSDRCFVGAYDIYMNGVSGRKYVLDYRVYRDGKWYFVQKQMDGSTYTIDEGINPIDDVRVRPLDSSIETYSWYPLIGLRSRTDGGGATESYLYDICARLQAVRNNSNDLVQQYLYNYAGNSPQIYYPFYTNDAMSMSFTKSHCNGSDDMAVPVEYAVPAHKYRSYESKSDANRIAFDNLIANGQKYADENGICGPYIKIFIYNPTDEHLLLRYAYMGPIWGEYEDFQIPPGQKISNTGDVVQDYMPTVIYLKRRFYFSAVMMNSDKQYFAFMTSSGYNFRGQFPYLKEDYEPDTDMYIITGITRL